MINVGPSGFNPQSLPPKQWQGGGNSMGQPPMGQMGQRPMGMGGGMNMGGMVQNPSFMQQPMQQQRPRNRMRGGMVDPSFSRMMEAKAGQGTADRLSSQGFKVNRPNIGMFPGISPSIFNEHFDSSGMARPPQQPQQQMGQGGGDPMQQMMQFWQMYQQLLGNRGQQ